MTSIDGKGDDRVASLETYPVHDPGETASAALADLVVVAEFRDPIYPGLVSTGKVERGGDKPYHTVINSENYHALQALLFTHRGKVDCIYIDPPYNSGARDWKYNNSYVEDDDLYRHSKWLAFMERRLLIAKELLNPQDSVLIVAIDEKEYLRLGLLLEQAFTESHIQMISTAVNPAAIPRGREFRRADEYLFYVMQGESAPSALPLSGDWVTVKGRTHRGEIRWDLLRKSADASARADRFGMFYPFFIANDGLKIHSIGDAIPSNADRSSVTPPDGTFAAWPIRQDGTEGRWRLSPETARKAWERGYIKLGSKKGEMTPVYYLTVGEQQKIADGLYEVSDRGEDGSVITSTLESDSRRIVPSTQWHIASHDSTQYGSRLLLKFLGEKRFPFPKSLYAVEDSLRFFVQDNPEAVVLDFFAGSGTTAHAVMRLNKQDGGRRCSISVTNNEVSAVEQKDLRELGLRPGDARWERCGICDFVTKPRIAAAITGMTPDGNPVQGDYKFTDEFPMADGFDENVEFFTVTYEAPLRLRANRDFEKVAPLLWLRAGSRGRRIDSMPGGWAVADAYGVLADLDQTGAFVEALNSSPSVTVAFIITDDDSLFEAVALGLPVGVEPVRMYDAYLRNFEIDAMRGAR